MLKKVLALSAIALFAVPVIASAAVVVSEPITHDTEIVFQAYPGSTDQPNSGSWNLGFKGLNGLDGDVISSVPGVLKIVPGKNWANFVDAAKAGVTYTIKNVVLTKVTPDVDIATGVFKSFEIEQHGTANVRLWWPLMYELPETKWTLAITYSTPKAFDDDGSGPNPATFIHTDVWSWEVGADLKRLKDLVELFHELPFGKSEVPLISDEVLYPELQAVLSEAIQDLKDNDIVSASEAIIEFEQLVQDHTITDLPSQPDPTGSLTGVTQTRENPAADKLVLDADFIAVDLGIWQPSK